MEDQDTSPTHAVVSSPDEKPRRRYEKHGLTRLKSAVRVLGGRVLDRRTALGRALEAWRSDLVEDLGGRETLSTQQAVLVDIATRTKLMLDSIDAWLLTRPSLVDRRKKALHAVVKERLALSSHLVAVLKDLGLERKAREVPTLAAYLKQRERAEPHIINAEIVEAGPRAPVDPAQDGGRASL